MVTLSAMYSSKEEQLCWNNIIAFCSWGEFANTVSAGRTGLLRELLMPLFPSEYADGFNFHHIAPHFLPSGFPLWRSREQGSGWNFISPGRPCTLSVVSPNLCCSQALIFSTWCEIPPWGNWAMSVVSWTSVTETSEPREGCFDDTLSFFSSH